MKMYVYVALIFIAFGLVHCSMPNDVKDTKNTTDELNKKTGTLNGVTGDLRDKSLKDISNERVNSRFEDLANAKTDISRLVAATSLCRSFAFQQWSGTGDETPQIKLDEEADAMFSLLPRLAALINQNYDLNKMNNILPSGGAPDNNWKNLASIAAVMETIDRDQQAAAVKFGVPAESIYSLIVKGLQYKSIYNRDKSQVPPYAREVLVWEQEAVFMLQLRHNYLPIMALSRLSKFATSQSREAMTFINAWMGKSLNIDQLDNAAKIEDQGVKWLQEALETQRVLKKLGYPLQFNYILAKIFGGVEIAIPADVKANLAQTPELAATFNRLQKSIDEVKTVEKTGQAPAGDIPADLLIQPPVAVSSR